MDKVRRFLTFLAPLVLVVCSLIFSLIGFWQQDYGWWRIAALGLVLGPFAWLLSQTLPTVIHHWKQPGGRGKPQTIAATILGVFC